MNTVQNCPECGGALENVSDCREYLNIMITWDFEDFMGVGQIHHLTVLSYNLQHPSLYSLKGLENAQKSLAKFVLDPTSYAKHGAIDLKNLASNVRDWKIAGTPHDHGIYQSNPVWQITAADVVRGGLEGYLENVKKWSAAVLDDLKKSGNIL